MNSPPQPAADRTAVQPPPLFPHIRRGALPLVLATAILSDAPMAEAHVKWFAPYDVAAAPLPLSRVFSPTFFTVFAATVAIMVVIHLSDRVIERGFKSDPLNRMLSGLSALCADIVRVTLGAFLLSLWLTGGIILTPELKTESAAVSWFQLGLAISTVTWKTSWIAGVGLVILYGIAIADYGLFHLLDYPLFLGIAAYVIILSMPLERLKPYALSILYFSMAVTLLWASVEKWAFGAWTMPLLAQHEHITLGIDHTLYMIMAGFVEFMAAFLLLYGRASQRLSAAMLLLVFIAAIIDFGKIDAVGHSMIIASLAVAVIAGNTTVNLTVQGDSSSIALGALEFAMSYIGLVLIFFAVYYLAHSLSYAGGA